MTPPAALIIIDMQQGMQFDSLPPRNNPDAEDRIALLHAAWRQAGHPIISVRHISRSPTSVFAPGQPGVLFQERFQPRHHEHVVEKNVPDAFIHTGLERWLHMRGIRDVVIVGVSTNNSVEATPRSAGNLGFITTVVSDATFAFEKMDIDGTLWPAAQVHAMALANLHGEYAEVLRCDEVLARHGMQ